MAAQKQRDQFSWSTIAGMAVAFFMFSFTMVALQVTVWAGAKVGLGVAVAVIVFGTSVRKIREIRGAKQ